jgi:hypothetical protein
MANNFQSAVTLILMNFFLKISFAFACVENRKKLWKKFFSFWLKMAPLAQGVGQKLFFCHNFGSIHHFSIGFLQ